MAVGQDGERAAAAQTCEQIGGGRLQSDRRPVLPIHADQTPHQLRRSIEADLRQGPVEHVAAPTGQEQIPGVRLEVGVAVMRFDPAPDDGKAAAHEIALEVERVVQIEHDDPGHRPPGAGQKMAWS
jgi:hypothetical protein